MVHCIQLASRFVRSPRVGGYRTRVDGGGGGDVNAVLATLTTTTVANVHRGAVLPEARVVVIVVPLAILAGFWFLALRRRAK